MKLSQLRRGFLAVVIAGICLLPSVSSAATTVVGTGPDTSYFVLESPNMGVRSYEIRYTFNSTTPQDAGFLLNQVLANDSLVTADIAGTTNLFVRSFTFNSITEANTPTTPFVPSWAHWVFGGQAGFPGASPVTASDWVLGSGISAPYRLIAPGSSDAFRYADFDTKPSVAPIPEPGSLLLFAGASLTLFLRKRMA